MNRTETKKTRSAGVLICGAYGMRNAGDEAVLSALLAELRKIDPDMPITVLSRAPKETQAIHGVEAIYSFNLPRVWRAMRRSRLFLHGGGSLVQDATSRRSLWYYLYTLVAAKRRHNRVMLYGCGIGPVTRPGNRRLAGRIINRFVDAITLREEQSLETLRALGVTKPEIIVAAEPALALESAPAPEVDALCARFGMRAGQNYFCLCVRHWPGMEQKHELFAAAAQYAREKYGLTPLLLCLNPKQDEADAARIRELIRGETLLVTESMEAPQLIGLLGRMEAVMSMRLHALIFASSRAVPLIGVSYDPKVASFFEYIEQTNYIDFSALRSAEQLFALIDTAMSADRETLRREIDDLRQRADRSRLVAQALLEKEKEA